MFDFLKRKKCELYAPVDGELLSLKKVEDPVFSKGMMGIGYAIEPTSEEVYSPVEGKVSSVFPTKHALGIVALDGTEVLLHLGIDTVELKGEGFEVHVKEGTAVTKHTKLVTMDLALIQSKGKLATVMVLVPNIKAPELDVPDKSVKQGDYLFKLNN